MGERVTRWRDRFSRAEGRVLARVRGWSVRRRWLVFVAAPLILVCCCGVPVGVPLVWAVRDAIEAGRGAASPESAADAYLSKLSYDNENGLLPLVRGEHRDELVAQWRAYRDAMKASDPAPFRLSWSTLTAGPVVGGRAEVRVDVQASWWVTDAQGRNSMWDSKPYPWVFEARQDDGWRVSRVDPTPWCGPGGYLPRCGAAPAPSDSASASVSPSPSEDLLRNPREMLRCGPRDPFRALHSCPPTSVPGRDPDTGEPLPSAS